jgi:hypothetical protein
MCVGQNVACGVYRVTIAYHYAMHVNMDIPGFLECTVSPNACAILI